MLDEKDLQYLAEMEKRIDARMTEMADEARRGAVHDMQVIISYEITYFTMSSASCISSSRSANAISGSIIQNSDAWRAVFEFSARNVGPNV